MDHVWDGFYTGHLRLQRFPTIVDLAYDYNLFYSGTPPKEQLFRLDGVEAGEGSIFRIPYPNAGTYYIYDMDGERIEPIVFSSSNNANNLPEFT